ncbi:Na-translocating system protein MpsC family protein [Crassaminicella profunda]|uniref:Na-translocating system protein MpsC family protein n=1 Tax=Crassaminicella profunda TaxID=1286698 RepID=UPI001CA6D19A|nr:Na-translocating system protein MpsC family protein [Crassaminicella profunda]QZY56112.1 Na-translocating system protein MpsC family protein [Crassaminicella profunda]
MDKKNMLYNMKLLYVEDEEVTRNEMGQFLKRRIEKVYLAENGVEGLKMYKKHKPDIIIADLIMPEMGGMEMIEHIRKENNDAFIIVTSALDDIDSILETVDIGINKYIIKPINTDELIDALENMTLKMFNTKDHSVWIELSEKKEIEDKIRKEFSHFIKKNTGKGPRNIFVSIQGNTIEIQAHEVLTPFEQSLLDHKKNNILVDQNRKLFYSIKRKNIELFVSKIVKTEVKMNDTIVNSLVNMDKVYFSIL